MIVFVCNLCFQGFTAAISSANDYIFFIMLSESSRVIKLKLMSQQFTSLKVFFGQYFGACLELF